MAIEFLAGLAVGGIVFGQYMHHRWEKRHMKCPHNPRNKANGSSKIGTIDSEYNVKGSSIQIGGKLIVDGVVITDGLEHCSISVTVEGDCHDLTTTNGDVEVKGSVGNNIKTTNGDVEAKDVQGSITTGNGDVTCGTVGGNITTRLGSINHR